MTAAPFIASLFASSAEGASVHGAFVQEPGTAGLRVEVGMASALPTLLLGGSTGLLRHVDLGAHAVTHAGLAHALGATVRWRPGDALGVGLTVDESLYTVEDLAGVESLRSPFGNRVAFTPLFLAATTTSAGVALANPRSAAAINSFLMRRPFARLCALRISVARGKGRQWGDQTSSTAAGARLTSKARGFSLGRASMRSMARLARTRTSSGMTIWCFISLSAS